VNHPEKSISLGFKRFIGVSVFVQKPVGETDTEIGKEMGTGKTLCWAG
jgi:hypothetical protein